jgi:hypothetical protein
MAKSQIRQYVFTPSTATTNPYNGKLVVQGKYDLNQILLITNSTKNVILYNFADSTYSGTTVTFSRANDLVNYYSSLDTADGLTTINLNSVDTQTATTGMLATDSIQILYERPEQLVRMPEVGTDAFERTRTSNPQSMLDADFEYGLQPTKWLTYDLMRGYPSVYEIAGTDQSVLSVITDASAGTGGTGESLITITNSTAFPSSWVVGTPITVKGYLNTVQGFARAEGSFLINSISGAVLTYYAKAKVGINNGDVLSSTYTQLRQGSFYTGSSVGTPTYSYANPTTVGTTSSGAIAVTTGSITGYVVGTVLTTSAGTPAIGQVLTGNGIAPGTYIISGSGTTWAISSSQTLGSSGSQLSFTWTVNTFTASGTSSGFAVGQVLSGTGVPTGATIIVSGSSAAPGVFTGTGGNGTYALLTGANVSSVNPINGTTGFAVVTVTFATNHGFIPGNTIINQVSSDNGTNYHSLAQGPYFVESVPSATTLTFTARASGQITGTITGVVYARPDAFFQHRPFDGGVMLGTGGPAHGAMAVRMSKKYIRYQSGKSINYNTGALFSPNYDIRAAVATNTTTTALSQSTGVSSTSSGVTTIVLATGGNLNNILTNMLVSGTGIAPGTYVVGVASTTLTINTPTIASIPGATTLTFTPSIQFTTDDTDHGCQPGAVVNIIGVITSGFSGQYTVGAIIDERNLLVAVGTTLANTTGAIGTPCTMQLINWWGSTVRAGTFDEQNGQFWQWDGQQLAIGRRSSTFQIAGSVTVTVDSNRIDGINTRFTSQLSSGDRIVIKGMTHVVSTVVSDTLLYVTPDYRGAVGASGVKMVKTIDRTIPQSQWNMDRCDGSNGPFNPSGFQIQPNKMQMIGLQWTWYGAGFIDWMIRGPDGKYLTVHRLRGNNLNTEAYMRSGNQPVRYEVVNESARSYLTADPSTGGTTLSVADVTYFPAASATYPAYVWVDNELISYTGRTTGATSLNVINNQVVTAGTLTGCTRAAVMPVYVAGSTRQFSGGTAAAHAINSGVILVGQTSTPSISHWGSAFLQDGGFDSDRGYIFNYQSINTSISTRKTTAFAIRLAPSVSNAIVGDLGVRELINRAQLLLQSIEITVGGSTNSNSAVVIEAILNPSNYPTNVANVTWNALNSTALQTGQPSFSQIATGTSVTFNGASTLSPTANIAIPTGATSIPVNSIAGVLVGDDVSSTTSSGILGLTKVSATGTSTSTFTGSTVTNGSTATVTSGAYISGTVLYIFGSPTGGTFSVGSILGGNGVLAGTFITALLTGTGGAGSTFSISQSQTVGSQQSLTTITGNLYTFTTTGVTGTIIAGQQLTGGSVTAGTYIVVQTSGTAGAAGTYAVNQTFSNAPTGATTPVIQINQALTSTIQAGSVVTVSRNTYAQPGETVFSFISSPANKDALDLTPFKELTNTPLGGRGTFPNGPDVLFINVYLTQGAPVLANLVLRWGEAQA